MSTETEVKKPEISLEIVKEFLSSNHEAKLWFQGERDVASTKALKSYEENFQKEKLPKILEDEISKRYPEETKEQKRLKELELKFQQTETEKNRAILQSKLLKKATEKQLPDFLVEYSLADDEETSYTKLMDLGNKYIEHVNTEVEARLAGTGRKIPINTDNKVENITLKDMPNDPDWYIKNAEALNKLINVNK